MSNAVMPNQKHSKNEVEYIDDEVDGKDLDSDGPSPTSRYVRVAILFVVGLLLIWTGIKFLFNMFEHPMSGLVVLPVLIFDLIWIALGAKAIIGAVKILMD